MKNFLAFILIITAFSLAGVCDTWSYTNSIEPAIVPTKSGQYYAITKTKTYSNGESLEIGGSFSYVRWEDNKWYKSHWISCSITDIEPKSGYTYDEYRSCYLLTLDCTVKERIQFYAAGVNYTDLKGYRKDGTLLWTRDEVGSTDIYCYSKSGMSVVKRVNDPYYCK